MTREEAQQYVKHHELIKAYAEGKTIQYKFKYREDVWNNVPNPEWNDIFEYRIKPEPREFWLVHDAATNYLIAYPTRPSSEDSIIHVKEGSCSIRLLLKAIPQLSTDGLSDTPQSLVFSCVPNALGRN